VVKAGRNLVFCSLEARETTPSGRPIATMTSTLAIGGPGRNGG
jgi:hypothetical protein